MMVQTVRRRQVQDSNLVEGLAVVITCHKPYLHYLRNLIPLWDSLLPPETQRVLVLDGCSGSLNEFPLGWLVISGNWGDPSEARSAGLHHVETAWCVFWDADNEPTPELVQSYLSPKRDEDVGILFPYVNGASVSEGLTRRNHIDTASCWRVQAIRDAKAGAVHVMARHETHPDTEGHLRKSFLPFQQHTFGESQSPDLQTFAKE